jgi:hypothetical protein
MSEEWPFLSPNVDFDPRLADELARGLVATPTLSDETQPLDERRSPLNGYVRMLTPEGGILILYRDQDRGPLITALRAFTWLVATGTGSWLILCESNLSLSWSLLTIAALMLISWLLVRQPVEVSHRVEIRPDSMIIDGEDVFYAEDIGDNWPELQMKDDDPNRLVIAGICGTRFVEFLTANRVGSNDRTPEVLADDLEAAMEQLWGRRELTFATTPDL